MKLEDFLKTRCRVICNLYLANDESCSEKKMVKEKFPLGNIAIMGYEQYEVVGLDISENNVLDIIIYQKLVLDKETEEALKIFFEATQKALLEVSKCSKQLIEFLEKKKEQNNESN